MGRPVCASVLGAAWFWPVCPVLFLGPGPVAMSCGWGRSLRFGQVCFARPFGFRFALPFALCLGLKHRADWFCPAWLPQVPILWSRASPWPGCFLVPSRFDPGPAAWDLAAVWQGAGAASCAAPAGWPCAVGCLCLVTRGSGSVPEGGLAFQAAGFWRPCLAGQALWGNARVITRYGPRAFRNNRAGIWRVGGDVRVAFTIGDASWRAEQRCVLRAWAG